MSNIKSSVIIAAQRRDDLEDLKDAKTLAIMGGSLEIPGVPTPDEVTAFKDKKAVTVSELGSLDFQKVNKDGSNFRRIARINATMKSDNITRKSVFPLAIAGFALAHPSGLVMVQVIPATTINPETKQVSPITTKSGNPVYNYSFSVAENGNPALSKEELINALQNATVAETEAVGG